VSGTHPYASARIALATMHEKERALGPAFRRVLGADVVAVPELDTDALGTFSGEVPRPDALVETLAAEGRAGVPDDGRRLRGRERG
jgi:hypothetical protein